jgi:penicillin-binding protein 1B
MQSDHNMPEPTSCDERIEQNPDLPERPRRKWWVRWSPAWIAVLVVVASSAGAFLFYQHGYGRNVEEELRKGAFQDTASIFVNSKTLVLGAPASAAETVDDLRRAGFTESRENPIGWFESKGDTLVIHAVSQTESTMLRFSANKIVQILALPDNSTLAQYQLDPQLITNVSLRNRERRRLLRFGEIPKILIDAVVSAEDKRFFRHQGFDLFRIVKAAYVNLGKGRAAEGASTITMQLARSLWLKPDKSWKRKEAQFFMALGLERKLSKHQIFEHYSNEVYLGHRGTYDIHGFGEATRVYFDKPIGALTLSEAATLAGVIQRPGYYNPFQFPGRVRQRRDRVLVLMHRNGCITDRELALAMAEGLNLSSGAGESVEAPYYVDLVKAELRNQMAAVRPGREGYEVHSTLDPRLQRAALEAVRIGMRSVDRQLRHPGTSAPTPQVALVALDPRTGSIKALVGGRDYNVSQLNHTLANRQPGSVFKPFVYAAALRSAEQQGVDIFTPATLLDDVPTTFWFAQQPYEPTNFKQQFLGEVTLRQALSKSLNVATIQLAERVGYSSVVEMARSAGFSQDIQPTPAVALGTYECTPLEIAAAYTVFANQGVYVQPHLVSHVRGDGGARIYSHRPVTHRVLTPQVAYLMVNLLEEVLRSGTGAGVRARGFTVPAAGKTGTSRDGWFAGFTTDLLCVVWVGFDDHRDLKLEGAKSALPIWTEFMKQAVTLMGRPKAFQRPSGIQTAQVDAVSGQLATPECPAVRSEVFITGTLPVEFCTRHGNPFVDTRATASPAVAQ